MIIPETLRRRRSLMKAANLSTMLESFVPDEIPSVRPEKTLSEVPAECLPFSSENFLAEIFSAVYDHDILLLRDIFKALCALETSETVILNTSSSGLTLFKLIDSRDVAFRLKFLSKHFIQYKCFFTTEAILNISHLNKIFDRFVGTFSLSLRDGRLTLFQQKDDFRYLKYSFEVPLSPIRSTSEQALFRKFDSFDADCAYEITNDIAILHRIIKTNPSVKYKGQSVTFAADSPNKLTFSIGGKETVQDSVSAPFVASTFKEASEATYDYAQIYSLVSLLRGNYIKQLQAVSLKFSHHGMLQLSIRTKAFEVGFLVAPIGDSEEKTERNSS